MRQTAAQSPRISFPARHCALVFAANLLVFGGCSTMPVRQGNWTPTTYQEEWTIRTEPAGCKVYVNEEYVGDSPLVAGVQGGEVLVSDFLGQNETFAPKRPGTWTIKACKDGYESAARSVVCGDDVLVRTFQSEKANINRGWWANPWAFAPPVITGKRSVLLELTPLSLARNLNETSPGNIVVQGAGGTRKVDEAARAEYEQSLAAYKATLERRNFSRLGANATAVSSTLPGGEAHPKFNAMMGLAQQYSLDDSDKEVEVARQRLDRATARMNHSEW